MSPVAWCAAMKLVPEEWRTEFCRFIEEGEASDGFILFLEQDEGCRKACEIVLRADREMTRIVALAVDEDAAVAT
jgi:hypothetical protein